MYLPKVQLVEVKGKEETVVGMAFLSPNLKLGTFDMKQGNVHASIGDYESTSLDWPIDHSRGEYFGKAKEINCKTSVKEHLCNKYYTLL